MLVCLHPFADLLFCCGLLLRLEVLAPGVEVAAFATLCLHKYERNARMGCADYVYKGVEIFVDYFC